MITGHLLQFRRLRLGQVNNPPVIAEVQRHEVRLTIQAQAADNQPLKMAHQKIRQVKTSRFFIGQLVKHLAAGKKLVAMRTLSSSPPVPQSA